MALQHNPPVRYMAVVWEAFYPEFSLWFPYAPMVSRFVERAARSQLSRVELADSDPDLYGRHVSLVDLKEYSPTGTRDVRRSIYQQKDSIESSQFQMPFTGWVCLPYNVQQFVDHAYNNGKKSIDLSKTSERVEIYISFPSPLLYHTASGTVYPFRRVADSFHYTTTLWPRLSTPAQSSSSISPSSTTTSLSNYSTESNVAELQQSTRSLEKQDARGQQCHQATANNSLQLQALQEQRHVSGSGSVVKTISNFFLYRQQHHTHEQPTANVGQVELPAPEAFGAPVRQLFEDRLHLRHMKVQVINLHDIKEFDALGAGWVAPLDGPQPGPSTLNRNATSVSLPSHAALQDMFNQLGKYIKPIDVVPAWKQPCPVCQLHMVDDGENPPKSLTRCQHVVHLMCFIKLIKQFTDKKTLYYHIRCPSCHVTYGTRLGNQPEGSMEWSIQPYELVGHDGAPTVVITYNFQSAVQSTHHPRPGKQYFAVGFPRQCFLPYDYHGRLILSFLIEAFRRRLLFTIDRSTTTGFEDVVQFCVDQKTRSNQFPDPTFFQRCLQQLVDLGVAD
ncbi:protein deltex-like isoform X2 [Anopheles coustani]|uniref:protein deltex-like isoform X2 n=2 Tax=coustani group TaxID=59130 RepID=UPI00265A2700|nr:protein deltex-like isoform X2 [Anopheles coustani]